jgi:hypothetical protein
MMARNCPAPSLTILPQRVGAVLFLFFDRHHLASTSQPFLFQTERMVLITCSKLLSCSVITSKLCYVGTGFGPMAFVAYEGLQPPTAPIGLACPHQPRLPPCWGVGLAPAVMPGMGLRMWYSAKPSMLFPFPYIFACLSLSLLLRQSLLYNSQFNISIRTWLISTGYEPGAFSSLESTSISFIISEEPPAIKVSYFDFVLLEPTTFRSIRIDAYY